MNNLIEKVKQWHYDRNLIEGSSDFRQFGKLMEEVVELHYALVNKSQEELEDAIGDIVVVLVNIAERNKTSLEESLKLAYEDIKHRKGKMVNGVFVKEE